jgi:NADH-quinone oxidoreductase subunit N
MDLNFLKSFTPEVFLSISILANLIFNARLINDLKFNFPLINAEILFQVLVILLNLAFIYYYQEIEGYLINFLFINNKSIFLPKIFIVISSIVCLIIIWYAFKIENINFFEYFNLFLLSLLSLLLLVSSYDFISIYLIIEMQALCFYTLASFKRDSAFSAESSLKYFISGSFISGLFLLGISLIYGLYGTLNLNDLSLIFLFPISEDINILNFFTLIGVMSVIVTFFFKIGAAPFHFWTPDVYDGAPLSSTIIFSIFPKIALFFLLKHWVECISLIFNDLEFAFVFVALCSTAIGTFLSLNQKRVKRLIIYSSIAQVGFLIAALTSLTVNGTSSIYFFFVIYIITSILIWSQVAQVYFNQKRTNLFYLLEIESFFLSNLSGLSKINVIWAFSFVLIFFSLGGLPPLSGFFAKIFILFSLIETKKFFIAFFLVLISSISVYYYIRMIKISFFESNNIHMLDLNNLTTYEKDSSEYQSIITSFLLFLLIFLFFFPNLLLLITY